MPRWSAAPERAAAGPAVGGGSRRQRPAGGHRPRHREVHVLAKPPVRKLARDLGVDLRRVRRQRPERHGQPSRRRGRAAAGCARRRAGRPDFDRGGRRAADPGQGRSQGNRGGDGRERVHRAARHRVRDRRRDRRRWTWSARLRELPDFAGVKVSPLLVVARALLLAVRRHPMLNSSWDEAAQEIVVNDCRQPRDRRGHPARPDRAEHQGCRGVAAAGSRPRARGADDDRPRVARPRPPTCSTEPSPSPTSASSASTTGRRSSTRARRRSCASARCGTCRGCTRASWRSARSPSSSLSFDHRIVDGQLGSQFLADLAALLVDPTLFAAWG